MNKYKFRGLSTDRQNWIYGLLSNGYEDSVYIFPRNPEEAAQSNRSYTDGWDRLEVIPESVGQMCLDSQGTEIYENDIVQIWSDLLGVEHSLSIGLVKFYEGCFGVDFKDSAIPVWCESYHLEVLGNIHQNSELLP